MSPKNQPQQDPRIAPKEMIITRRKSAMLKRQLREKDRSMKSITQLLKTPIRTYVAPFKKQKLSPKGKSPKKKQQQPEAPPGNLNLVTKRPKLVKDRVWLQPRPNFKMVARTNKRKLCTPQKELEEPPIDTEKTKDEPMSLTRMEEDSDSLDDEGLLEILTCPSPVWWEDPPDPSYSEKPICTRLPSPDPVKNVDKTICGNLTNINKRNHDTTFVNKRKKLENVLGNIKSRIIANNINDDDIDDDNDDDKSELDSDLLNDEMLWNLENIDIPVEPVNEIENEDKTDEISFENTPKIVNIETLEFENVFDKKIPTNLPPLQRNPMHSNKNVDTQRNFPRMQVQSDVIENNVTDYVIERNEIKNSTNSSPVLDKAETKDVDTISDTNIKFIDKVEDKELDDTSQLILDKIKKFFKEKGLCNKKEYITVYKIVDNDEKQELKNDDQSRINYFYKKCKNVRKKSDVSKDASANSEQKTLALPNSEVKYCFKCSSIFETIECHYCAMSEARECVCDQSQDSRSDLSCDTCDDGDH